MNDLRKQGWVRFYRKSIDSSVWKNPIIWMVWSWCLLKANHEDTNFPFNGNDLEIKSGQFITGRNKAIKELPISAQNWKTAIAYLKSTNRIDIKPTNKFSIIIVLNWEEYQKDAPKLTSKLTSNLNNHQTTTNQPLTTYKNDKKDNNEKKSETSSLPPLKESSEKEELRGAKSIPPTLNEVSAYCHERKNDVDAQRFIDFYESKGWMIGRNKMKSWRASVRTWENNNKPVQSKPNTNEKRI